MVSRYWGTGHLDTDTSVTTIAKTVKQLIAWVHLDHFSTSTKRSKGHRDLLHNGLLVITLALANMHMQLLSGGIVGGVAAAVPFPNTAEVVRLVAAGDILRVGVGRCGTTGEPVLAGLHETYPSAS